MERKIPEKFLTAYNPKKVEDSIYKEWEASGYFNPDNLDRTKIKLDEEGKEKVFSIVLPPPNVTGTLHTGHSLMISIEDTLVRFYRMNGYRTLWLPGTDHAAIATQVVVEKALMKEEKKSRHDLGREEFLKRVNLFALESQNTILSQFRSLGATLDWSRLTFTLDDKRNIAVNTMFERMYKDGLIYQGDRVVNWDPKGQTVISDDEIVHVEREATLYTFKYAKDFPIAISTTRPETKLGDTAVAVHPEDARYQQYVDKIYQVNFCGVDLEIKIIADVEVDPEFGTGALGVTPAHSQIDEELARKHNLPSKQVINEYAKIINTGTDLDGKKVQEARELIINYLKKNNLSIKEETITQNVSTAERTGGIIEPLPKKQWFIGVNREFTHFGKKTTLKILMLEAVEKDGLKIIPERFEKIYFHWVNNLRDWCISRQIWYGHRIPVWYDEAEEIVSVGFNDNPKLTQDEDTLDTWFSSGMWTFSALGWPFNKDLGFDDIFIEDIVTGKKTYTLRLTEKDFLVEDIIHFQNSNDNEYFGYGKITNIAKVKLNKEEINSFKQYYPSAELTVDTHVWKYSFIYSKKSDLEIYHPTSLLETGPDIIFFWVARMILMSMYALNEIPFQTTYIHGLVRDKEGRKMSKSLGNALDPRELIEKYGADALRMAQIVGNGPGNDLRLEETKIKAYKNFANKIWNASRFVLEKTADYTEEDYLTEITEKADLEIYKQTKDSIQEITEDLENYRLHLASEKIYAYFWHEFCDKQLEYLKNRILNKENTISAQATLLQVLRDLIITLHPFMPYLTEEIWKSLKRDDDDLLLVTKWTI